MKFIIVDDNSTFREGIKFYLENILKHEVIALAKDGLEFLSLDNLNEADIIIMDIEMPVMDGIEAIKKALWEYNHLNFIAVTSYADHTSLLELIGAGFKSCVLKSEIYKKMPDAINVACSKGKIMFPKEIKL